MEGIYSLMDVLLPFPSLQFSFMKNAFLAILLLTPLLGLLGTMAVNQQMAFFSDALGHSALTGIGLGMILGVGNDLVSMLVFGVIWAVLIGLIKHTGSASADTVISVFSSTSVAAGLLILSRGGGFAKYSSLLIGDILAVTPQDILYLLLALIAGTVLWMLLYNGLLLTSINASLAHSRSIPTRLYEIAFSILVAVAVMLAIRWVGVLLINALLILPAALIAALTALGAAAAWIMGIPVLSFLVGKTAGQALAPYRGALLMVILGGGFYALLNLLYYILVIFGRQKQIFLIYCGTTLFAKLLADHLVQRQGIPGAALSRRRSFP